jgi:hypothetical protein
LRYNKNKLDYYLVKSAYSKTWEESKESSSWFAAEAYCKSIPIKLIDKEDRQTLYIHVKHLYDGEISKFKIVRTIKQYLQFLTYEDFLK